MLASAARSVLGKFCYICTLVLDNPKSLDLSANLWRVLVFGRPFSMSTAIDIELAEVGRSVSDDEQYPLLDNTTTSIDEEQGQLLDIATTTDEEQGRLLDNTSTTDEVESDWDFVVLKPRHTIFLSHSGAQKNFVEQLYEDLERAKQAPFFDKRPDSLPKGEKFAQLIFQAARQCQLAVVVVTEDYFTRSKWPMLELAAFVEAHHCTILPLFFGLSCREFGDEERRQAWFKRWEEWAETDPRISVHVWKEALYELDRRNGLEYSDALGEVTYRKEVVATACSIVQLESVHDDSAVLPPLGQGRLKSVFLVFMMVLLKIAVMIVLLLCLFLIMVLVMTKLIVPFMEKYIIPEPFKSPPGGRF